MLRRGGATSLIVYCGDRLTRAVADMLTLRDEFRRHEVTLHLVNRGQQGDSAEDDPFATIESGFATYERRKIVERAERGRRGKIDRGQVVGNGVAPYGYDYVGNNRERKLVINEDEARVVRLLYIWYAVECISVARMVVRLTEMCIPTANDRRPGRVSSSVATHSGSARPSTRFWRVDLQGGLSA